MLASDKPPSMAIDSKQPLHQHGTSSSFLRPISPIPPSASASTLHQRPISPLPRSPSPIPLTPYPPSPPGSSAPPSPSREHHHHHPIPVPWLAILPLLFFRLSDAVAYSAIFPFITDMITSFQPPAHLIGLYAGIAEGTMMLVEACVAPTWAKLADKYGRRPCLVWGWGAVLGSGAIVGFSGSVPEVIFWRAVFGLNPVGVLGKLTATELSHPSHRAKMFSVFSPAFSGGMMVGTFIGGEFARPYERLPRWLGGQSRVWRRWPFALPGVITSFSGFASVAYAYFYLKESRPPPRTSHDSEHQLEKRSSSSGRLGEAFRVPHFLLVTLVFCSFQLCVFAESGIYTVITFTDTSLGGYGLSVSTIGLLFAIQNLTYLVAAPVFIPRLQARFGVVASLKLVFAAFSILCLLVPLAQWTAVRARWAMWVVLVVQMLLKNFANFAWPLCDVLTFGCFDSFPQLLASGSAISLIAGAIGRAVGPALAGWIFSASTTAAAGTLGRQVPWVFLILLTGPLFVLVRWVPSEHEISKGEVAKKGEGQGKEEAGRLLRGGGEGYEEEEAEEEEEVEVERVTGREVEEGRERIV